MSESHHLSDPRIDEFVEIRHAIHRHPELAFQETRTAELVAGLLEDWGYAVERGLGDTGVVGTLRRGNGKRRLGLRADMDALPIHEASGRPYASAMPGVMHACGHDGHTAMLLAAAKRLARDVAFSGTLHLIFQPAEEGAGGALRMIRQGLFDRHPCDAIFAMHNMPGIAQGHLVLRDGPMMASSDTATIQIEGHGGHGAMPHRANDPVVAAASLVLALQTIVARNVDPLDSAVVTVGTLHSGTARNVIPTQATLELSVRALRAEVRGLLKRRIEELVRGHAQSFGLQMRLDWAEGYIALVNDAAQTDFARSVALELLGPEKVTLQGGALTGSEDFSFMLDRVPGSYLLIGNGEGSEAEPACMVHNPGYDFNDANIAVGADYWVLLATRFLQDTAA